MTLFILAETSAGYALLKAKDKKLLKRDDLAAETESAEGICSLLKLKQFQKFDSAATALDEVSALVEGKVSPLLSSLLNSIKDEKKVSLAVADPKLGNAINKLPSLSLAPISDSTTSDLYRAIRNHLPSLIPGLLPLDISTMSLGLSHSLSRHKLKFSPDKVDTMIVQAIALLDDLDKELNTYAMRVKEWYGWHFPEMGRIVNDNLAYAKVIFKMGLRSNASTADLAEILPEEIETAVKAAAEVSMGTEITSEDLDNIKALAEQVIDFTEYRQQLSSYLSARMNAIAPNLTILVGELVGARLIAHAGSLMNLAKSPASTIQILGAEKALFRALKTKHDTPKYGLIYHASLIGQATGKNKGKIARMLATKSAIGLRVDALADWGTNSEGQGEDVTEEEKSALGRESRLKIERRLRGLEGKPLLPRGVAIGPNGNVSGGPGKWEVKEARKYNADADGLAGDEPAAAAELLTPTPKEKKAKREKKSKKDKEGDVKMIEEVADEAEKGSAESDEDEDEEDEQEAEDEEMGDSLAGATNSSANGKSKHKADDSGTLATGSDESSVAPKSSALGSTTKATKSHRKGRHEQQTTGSEENSQTKKPKDDKSEKRLDRKERKQKKKDQGEQFQDPEEAKLAAHAKEAGLNITRYKRKLERGEIQFGEDGKARAISKKDIKKAKKEASSVSKKEAKKAKKEVERAVEDSKSKKRKREDGEKVDKSEKKKKKKSKD